MDGAEAAMRAPAEPGSVSGHLAEPHVFTPLEGKHTLPDIDHGNNSWTTALAALCRFPPEVFEVVMLDLVRHPKLTSSNIVRADIIHDSAEQVHREDHPDLSVGTYEASGWHCDRYLVRRLIPRNQQRDRLLEQTCLFLSRDTENNTESLVIYIPHVMRAEDMPHYHPTVKQLAFHHSYPRNPSPLGPGKDAGKISLSYAYFDSNQSLDDTRLDRTALKLLQTVHKHGEGQLTGYEKRVHHDQIIPQKRYQDTYARLKAKYGKQLTTSWVEVTDPVKHVFEDIGIAAFLIELWDDTYHRPVTADAVLQADSDVVSGALDVSGDVKVPRRSDAAVNLANGGEVQALEHKLSFPGFVDIGCGNGILVYILLSEGYSGFGFDARERKSWSTFPTNIRKHLKQQVLVPEIFRSTLDLPHDGDSTWHDGVLERGTFIVSNHADELTAWTPLLAYLNHGAFLAIPCCSHDLAGARFRAPESVRKPIDTPEQDLLSNAHTARLPQQVVIPNAEMSLPSEEHGSHPSPELDNVSDAHQSKDLVVKQAAETGSLKRSLVQKKMSSAYSTLCSYLASISEAVGFEVETEVLRIPSTRNHSVIGRRRREHSKGGSGELGTIEDREALVKTLIEREMGLSIRNVAHDWVMRAGKIAQKPGSGH
ncbi:tRNA(Ser) Um(44) 2'-O-methyltransferase [Oleoguttula sp. CCFEE 5521]